MKEQTKFVRKLPEPIEVQQEIPPVSYTHLTLPTT